MKGYKKFYVSMETETVTVTKIKEDGIIKNINTNTNKTKEVYLVQELFDKFNDNMVATIAEIIGEKLKPIPNNEST